MPPNQTVQNNFKEGFKTEFTGLNFPENAATDTQNCVYTLIGDVFRREGFNYEANAVFQALQSRTGKAMSTYRWKNVGGDGLTEVLVVQIGAILYFFRSSSALGGLPLSTTLLSSTVDISAFTATNGTFDTSIECQFTDGNGYLFVFNQNCDPFSCIYNAGVITGTIINLQIRDFAGIPEPGIADNFRPTALSAEHQYNLINQGWTAGSPWTANASGPLGVFGVGQSITFTISSQTNTTSVTNGSNVQFIDTHGSNIVTGTVSSYLTPFTSLTMTITSGSYVSGQSTSSGTLTLVNVGFINTWQTAIGNYPSNSDVWWLYKNTSQVFSPSTTIGNVQQPFGPATKGSFIINPFIQNRTNTSGIAGLTTISTTNRPTTGTWFQGRVWYSGINASFQATGDAPYTTWTENIYFSQVITAQNQFGRCYQENDPTSQNLFAELPTDGGVVTIQGCGTIYKLFPLQNGVIVFAANGVWFIGGSQGVGFSATDFAVSKISNVQCLSGTSFINVLGFPVFWNEEGIYTVSPSQDGGSVKSPDIRLDVNNICLGTILTYYQNIPKQSKKFARGDYDPINYVAQWCFRSSGETSVTDRYQFDTILNLNVSTKAFYPYTFANTPLSNGNTPFINDIKFIQSPGGTSAPAPVFKYLTSTLRSGVYTYTFSEENDPTYVDFKSEDGTGVNFTSYFLTGYMLPGQALRKIQLPYVYMFSRNPANNAYIIQAVWDYAGDGLSGKFTTKQTITNSQTDFTMLYRKIRLRGRGMAVQIKISSVSGQPFDLMGWSVLDQVNQVV
jgi:hypothetical protein